MIPDYLSPLANHLWQSTIVAAMAALLTLALRHNPARVRYGLWFAAVVKFLIPFALLVSVGRQFEWRTSPPLVQRPVLTVATFSMPFDPAPGAAVAPPAPAPARRINPVPYVLLAVWLCGVVVNVWSWFRSWRRVRGALLTATPLNLDLPIGGVAVRTMSSPMMLEPAICGVFRQVLLLPDGIADHISRDQLKAVLIHELCHVRRRDNLGAAIYMVAETLFWFYPPVRWIGKRLIDERERACDEEVLRLGNEPLVYAEGILNVCKHYLESPLNCTSGVTGSDLKRRIRAILAGGFECDLNFARKAILTTVAVATLAAPVVIGIMHASLALTQPRVSSPPPEIERPTAAVSAAASPVPPTIVQQAAQQTTKPPAAEKAPAAQPPTAQDWQTAAGGKMAFEVASVKRGSFVPPSFPLDVGDSFTPTGGRFIANFPLLQLITFAYKFAPAPQQREFWAGQLPDWAQSSSERYTIEGKAPIENPTKDQFRLMMQSLLADRFKVAVHFETRQGPMLALTLANPGKLGPRLHSHDQAIPCDAPPDSQVAAGDVFPPRCGSFSARPAPDGSHMQLGSRNVTMAYFAQVLTGTGNAPLQIIDRTGLSGTYDFTIDVPGTGIAAIANTARPQTTASDPGPTVLDAVRDQMGLKLEPTTGAIQILVVDRLEKPTEN